eukprot:1249171-Pyramimonas_sp.AAC.1
MRVSHGFYSHTPSRIPPARAGLGKKEKNRTCHPFTPHILSTARQPSVKSAPRQLRPDHDSCVQKKRSTTA